MGFYLVRREMGPVTKEDVDAAALRGISCAYNYEGLRWVSSAWNLEAGRIYCTYEARNEQQIIDHSAQSRLPCDEILPVEIVRPEQFVGPSAVVTG